MPFVVRMTRHGWWEYDIQVVLPDGSKYRERKKSPRQTERTANQYAEARERHLIVNGAPAKSKDMTFGEMFDLWFEQHIVANRRKPSYQANVKRHWNAYLRGTLLEVELREFSEEHVRAIKTLHSAKKPKTVNNALSILLSLQKFGNARGILAKIVPVEFLKVQKPVPKFFTPEDLEKMILAAKKLGKDYLAALLLGADLGLRSGEILAITGGHIDIKSKTILIDASFWKGKTTETKGYNARHLPLTSRLAEALEPLIEGADERLLPISYDSLAGMMDRIQAAAKVRKLGLHALRHTFGTQLIANDVNPRIAQGMLRHADMRTTERYTHVVADQFRAAIGKLEK